ncbi:MAG: TraR/DksA C4-type zinc finger protein [Deferribacterota bacterium]|nr:TraR/DksA C4-type zinc finger protein [Deferribacterota bacterium]
MDRERLEYFRKKLLKMKRELINSLKTKYDEAKELEDRSGKDLADEAYDLYTKSLMLGKVETDALKLRLVEQALQRIDVGTYGVCIECEEDIDEKRLEYIPFARYCTECKSELEKSGKLKL